MYIWDKCTTYKSVFFCSFHVQGLSENAYNIYIYSRYRYNAVQYNMIFHKALRGIRHYLNQSRFWQKTQGKLWGSFVSIFEKIGRVIAALHFTYMDQWVFNMTPPRCHCLYVRNFPWIMRGCIQYYVVMKLISREILTWCTIRANVYSNKILAYMHAT